MSLRTYLAAICFATMISASANAQNIVIGLSAPTTGPAATAGVWERWGVDLALDEVNSAGGLLGRKLEVLSLDNHCNPAEAVNVANKLVEAKVAAIIGAHCSSGTLASMPIIQEAKIPMITGVSTAPAITAQSGVGGNDYMFRINPSDQDMMDALGIYLGKKTKFKKVAVVAEDSDFGRGGASAFAPAAKKNGLEILSTDFYPQNTPDFTSILTRVQQERPDAIALFQLGGDQLNFLRNAMQVGIKIPYTGRAELGGKNMQFIEAGGMEGSVGAWFYSAEIDTPLNKAFVAATQKRFNSIPYLQTWHGYSCFKILAQAIKEAGSADPVKIHDALKKISYQDVMGETMKFDDHNQAGKLVVIQGVKDKKVQVIDLVQLP